MSLEGGQIMTLNKFVEFDKTLSTFEKSVKTRVADGERMLSLSMYGDPQQPLFAAVWDDRPDHLLPLRFTLGKTLEVFKQECNNNIATKFYPVFVSATGGGSNARFSGVFEKVSRGTDAPAEITFHESLDDFKSEVESRAFVGSMIRNATIYDDVNSGARVTAIWRNNVNNTSWIALVGLNGGLSESEHVAIFKAQSEGWARLAFVTASSQHRFLAIYRDDHIAQIGTGFAQEFYSSTDEFKARRLEWVKKGFFHQYFQGFGTSNNRRYVALYVVSDKVVGRQERITGSPAVGAIDNAVLTWMKASSIRGAALAIVDGPRLVLARGYTWAEPDYPDVTPKTMFRLGSTSKMITALSIHQLFAEGKAEPTDLIHSILKLKTPDGKEPEGSVPNHQPYLTTTIGGLLENTCLINPHYESQNEAIVAAANKPGQVPATCDQIASWMITQPPAEKPGPNDGGFFLAAEIVKRLRKVKIYEAAFDPRVLKPLNITRIAIARSLHKDQKPGDARHHPRGLGVRESIMSPDRPLVSEGYGEENYETFAPSGGFKAAALDYARMLAALSSKPYTPLGRSAVDSLIDSAKAGQGGHGFDVVSDSDPADGTFEAWKGGFLNVGQTGIYYQPGGLSYVILWNGLHFGRNLRDFDPEWNGPWWPRFHAVLDPAKAQAWPPADLFPDPEYGMPSFPDTEGNWRRCKKCESLHLVGKSTAGACAAGGTHFSGAGNRIPLYRLMVNSKLEYGQKGWLRCVKCCCVYFAGNQPGPCAGGGVHDGISKSYSLVVNSPYKEHDQSWRWCKKCQTLYSAEDGPGKCTDGGIHDGSASGVYSIA